MDKEKLAQTLINNYFELIKVIDPSVLENDELLVEYLDILQAKISEEKSKHVEQVQEVEEELEEQLEQTTEISPTESEIVEAVEEVVEEVEEERKTTFQDKLNKLKELFSIKRINIIGENIIKTILPRRPKKADDEVLEIDDEIDMDYVNELAEIYVRTGQLVTLAPLSEKYSKAIGRRVQELKSSKEFTKESTVTPTVPTTYEQDENIFITTSTVPQKPAPYTPVPTVTMTKAPDKDIFITPSPVYKQKQPVPRPTKTPMAQSATKPLSEEDLIYIEKAARMYLELGYLPTMSSQPPLFANEIIARAKEIEKEESKSTELSDMFEHIDKIAETTSSIKK